MNTFLVTFVVFALAIAGMAVGVALTGKRLKGSCGMTGDDCACSALRARSCPHREA